MARYIVNYLYSVVIEAPDENEAADRADAEIDRDERLLREAELMHESTAPYNGQEN